MEADAVYAGWLKAYLVRDGGQTYFANSLTDRSMAFMWGQAYLITGVEDAYDRSQSAADKQLVRDLLVTFEKKNSADLSWDSWNDDTAWAIIALIRGYQITGDATYRDAATKAWDMAYKRGWDTTYGGGIWEDMDHVPSYGKCGLSNWPFVISGALINSATNDASYLTKSQQIYAWARSNLFDTTTGLVHEQIGPKGVIGDDNAYNSGLIVNAAASLYQLTHDSQYFDDAKLAAKHVIGKYPIMTEDHPANGDFGGDQFFRGLSRFARENGLWSTYAPWLENNADAAWSHRRTDYDVSLNNFTKPTPSTNFSEMEAEGSVVVQMVTQLDPPVVAGGGSGGSGGAGGNGGSGGSAVAGAATTGGSPNGGSGGSAGIPSGGSDSNPTAGSAGGGGDTLNHGGAGGLANSGGDSAASTPTEGGSSNGCSCKVAATGAHDASSKWAWLTGVVGLLALERRRRPRS